MAGLDAVGRYSSDRKQIIAMTLQELYLKIERDGWVGECEFGIVYRHNLDGTLTIVNTVVVESYGFNELTARTWDVPLGSCRRVKWLRSEHHQYGEMCNI